MDRLDVDKIRKDIEKSDEFGYCHECRSECFVSGDKCRGCGTLAHPHHSPMPWLASHCERLLELTQLQEKTIARLVKEKEELKRMVLQLSRENPIGESSGINANFM